MSNTTRHTHPGPAKRAAPTRGRAATRDQAVYVNFINYAMKSDPRGPAASVARLGAVLVRALIAVCAIALLLLEAPASNPWTLLLVGVVVLLGWWVRAAPPVSAATTRPLRRIP